MSYPQQMPDDDGNEHVHPERRALLWVGRALAYAVYAYIVVVEIILGLGFVLLLFGANPQASFVDWVYRSMDRAMEPFRGIFTPIDLGERANQVESVLDTSVLFAMIVYGIIAIAIRALLDWLTGRIGHLDQEDRARQEQQFAIWQAQQAARRPADPRQQPPGSGQTRIDPPPGY
jgi:hypothetical protein